MQDTIAAQATAPGRGGIGIIRISGSQVTRVAQAVLGKLPKPRYAEYLPFLDSAHNVIDMGIALYFPKPHSFTGEDVLELHGHGGPIVLDCLLQRILQLGIKLAKPGEFTERAFLNDKLDLAQAEAVADLINASSEQAARSAMNSLQGEFSREINLLQESLIHLRMYIEAAIDFPEEEIDFLSDTHIANMYDALVDKLKAILAKARQGNLLREGMTVVITGRPNAGKSSLLNKLTGRESAIVTDIPGTTRDILREYIHIDGMPLHIIDTAGLRKSTDVIEQEGIRRARREIEKADRILLVVDSTDKTQEDSRTLLQEFFGELPPELKLTIVHNKIDLVKRSPVIEETNQHTEIYLSAGTGAGVELLREHLKSCMGYDNTLEGGFIARRRHLDALNRALTLLQSSWEKFQESRAGELLAEDLRQVQIALSEITGEFHSDDLLGKIFSSFCIGK